MCSVPSSGSFIVHLPELALLALSMAERETPLPEPQVRGIEVGRVLSDCWGNRSVDPATVDRSGNSKPTSPRT